MSLLLSAQRIAEFPATSGSQIRGPDQVLIGMTKEESRDYVSASQHSANSGSSSDQRVLDFKRAPDLRCEIPCRPPKQDP